MGYDLHITRQEFSASVEGPVISPEEWLALVADDPELTISERRGPYLADWSGPGKYPCWLNYDNGSLYSKNPTDEMIEKMVEIAERLGAKVQGDDGEVYLGGGKATDRDQGGNWFVYPLSGSTTLLENEDKP